MKPTVDGVVLAGGRSRRMGSRDKALVRYRGRALFEYAVENLAPHVRQVLINRSGDTEFPSFEHSSEKHPATSSGVSTPHDWRIIVDRRFLLDGPLSGILNTFEQTDADFLMIASCDQLVLPQEVYASLLSSATSSRGVYAFDGEHPVPTCAVLPRAVMPLLEAALTKGELRLTQFMQKFARPAHFENTRFANINSIDQLES